LLCCRWLRGGRVARVPAAQRLGRLWASGGGRVRVQGRRGLAGKRPGSPAGSQTSQSLGPAGLAWGCGGAWICLWGPSGVASPAWVTAVDRGRARPGQASRARRAPTVRNSEPRPRPKLLESFLPYGVALFPIEMCPVGVLRRSPPRPAVRKPYKSARTIVMLSFCEFGDFPPKCTYYICIVA
jgi:hypothetical protein